MLFVRRSYFTLIEIMVVLALGSIIVGAIGFSLKGILAEQTFLSNARQFLEKLSIAQNIMLISDVDVDVIIEKDPLNKILVSLSIESPLSEPKRRLLEKKVHLPYLEDVLFNDQSVNPLVVHFSPTAISQGTLSLIPLQKESKKIASVTIPLPGFPTPLKIGEEPSSLIQFSPYKVEKNLYPTEILENKERDKKGNSNQT